MTLPNIDVPMWHIDVPMWRGERGPQTLSGRTDLCARPQSRALHRKLCMPISAAHRRCRSDPCSQSLAEHGLTRRQGREASD